MAKIKEWYAKCIDDQEYWVLNGSGSVAIIVRGMNPRETAILIVSAVNACAKINPENPQAAAEAIPALYEALIWFQEWSGERIPNGERPNLADVKRKIDQALALADGK